ncbi:ABC transporter permease subunit [Jeotgalibacillus sp. ET6]|uniref:ABC transporter permease subunit n=1 Tax=Jeotgalibacillus sp. ET6 TaxID=3037260 RepID=UPI0024184E93|nr:ABC transporter permease subunit [Jeotgalibacillus sp. ET6]MDG5472864.1 ABC transporter permease subunit [Jeotgalibacillus sp. ET6]
MNRSLAVGFTMLILLLLMTFIGPYISYIDRNIEHLGAVYTDDGILVPPFSPSLDFLLGSDRQGRDVLSLLVVGARETLFVLLAIVAIRFACASVLGIGAYYSSAIKALLALWNQVFSFMPSIFFVIFVMGLPFIIFSEQRQLWFILTIALVEVGRSAKILHGSIEQVSKKSYVEAGVVSGCTPFTLFIRYFWPSLRIPLVTNFITDMGRALFLLAQFAVIGVFLQFSFDSLRYGGVDTVNDSYIWPSLLHNIHQDILSAQWVVLSTVGIIAYTMMTFHLLSDGLGNYYEKKYNRIQ